VGSITGGIIGDSIKPPATRGFSIPRWWRDGYRFNHPEGSNPWPWLGKGPDAWASGGAAGLGGSGPALFAKGGC
jgi:hypothetical protein